MKFKIVRVPLTKEEKRQRAEEYNEFSFDHIDVEEFVNKDIYDEYIDMKCLNCGNEVRLEADILLECMEMNGDDYPVEYCSECDKPKLVPIDIYNQIKSKKKR